MTLLLKPKGRGNWRPMTMRLEGGLEVWTWRGITVRVAPSTPENEVAQMLLDAGGFKPL